MSNFETKDSGARAEYASGMVRDTEEGKARFDLLFPLGIPYSEQMLTRFAELMARGAKKYEARNWEKAQGAEELARYRSSALRHLIQWMTGETDEDHAAAVLFNVVAGETVRSKMDRVARLDAELRLAAESVPSIFSRKPYDPITDGSKCDPGCGLCLSDGCKHHGPDIF